ncbi:uncharacterized protein LOC113303850 [Papaver somniferum]|uniref:uncharacterized protein LOC113303850 n=1 Tax=Papaver somniferum TaxID=3469 RepID=UPI000E6F929F|nr:uncharacterized protein LOC113303850 [Papaver somniferum]
MLQNVDIEEPDTDWSDWVSTPVESHAISDQDKYEISFFIKEGYRQEGFHSGTCSDSSRSISEAWLVEQNGTFETHSSELISHSPPQPSEIQQCFSPTIFLVSDIEESELISDCDLPSPAIKRLNPEQQTYLNSTGIGSSPAPHVLRTFNNEELDQWINFYRPAKNIKLDNLELPVCSPFIISIICTLSSAFIEDNSTQPTTTAPPADIQH